MKDTTTRPLFIFEMANNHMGSVEHGVRIVEEMKRAVEGFPFSFAVKLQYRDIDTFIHPDYRNRTDLKFVKRFSETRLSWDDYKKIKDAISDAGFISVCTPWDELSVDIIEEHGYDFIKIPSCYLTDWPLLERIAKSNKPLIASTAGVALEDIDRVVSFFRHREKVFSIMHCVGEYPTLDENLNLGQIRLLMRRYPGLEVGYSTHENPDNVEAVKIAIGFGATMFEKHVGVPTDTIKLNGYSANPKQVRAWLESAAAAYKMCGSDSERYPFTELEQKTLRDLQRGVFAKHDIREGERLQANNVFFAIPADKSQIVANDFSKYTDFYALKPIPTNGAAMSGELRRCDRLDRVYKIVGDVKKMLKKSKVVVPGQCELEISHHYGIENFAKYGSTVITVVNREYCKRVIVLLPGQEHPEQWHQQKDETYHILHGEILLNLDGDEKVKKANEVVIIPRGVKHGFTTKTGTVIEEVSSSYSQNDSFYTDKAIEANQNRKTFVSYWMDR
ncbi:MAG TPA: N-acetylneuraminate synthase family protein [Terriglobales bacterium]|nr:N-acetylneuraminate synthase family protein [Terriglobales bacterium]